MKRAGRLAALLYGFLWYFAEDWFSALSGLLKQKTIMAWKKLFISVLKTAIWEERERIFNLIKAMGSLTQEVMLSYRGIISGLSLTVTNTAKRVGTTFQYIKLKMMMKSRYCIRSRNMRFLFWKRIK